MQPQDPLFAAYTNRDRTLYVTIMELPGPLFRMTVQSRPSGRRIGPPQDFVTLDEADRRATLLCTTRRAKIENVIDGPGRLWREEPRQMELFR